MGGSFLLTVYDSYLVNFFGKLDIGHKILLFYSLVCLLEYCFTLLVYFRSSSPSIHLLFWALPSPAVWFLHWSRSCLHKTPFPLRHCRARKHKAISCLQSKPLCLPSKTVDHFSHWIFIGGWSISVICFSCFLLMVLFCVFNYFWLYAPSFS